MIIPTDNLPHQRLPAPPTRSLAELKPDEARVLPFVRPGFDTTLLDVLPCLRSIETRFCRVLLNLSRAG